MVLVTKSCREMAVLLMFSHKRFTLCPKYEHFNSANMIIIGYYHGKEKV